jgi:NADH-quinone oxidoreductase subunit L
MVTMEMLSPSYCALVALGAPLLGALFNGLSGDRGARLAGRLGLLAMIGCAAGAVPLCVRVLLSGTVAEELYVWSAIGDLQLTVGLEIDPLAAVLLAGWVVVGLAVHLWLLGVEGNRVSPRSAAAFNLTTVAVVLALIGDGYGSLAIGWGLLGLCSHVLVDGSGRMEAASGARKLWVIDRLGDMALLLGIVLLLAQVGSLKYAAGREAEIPERMALWSGLLLLTAAAVKGGQIPFHYWWSSAVGGPAVANALVHATAMGMLAILLLTRSPVLFAPGSIPGQLAVVIGGLSGIMGIAMALGTRDVQRGLGHATTSQLGFVFVAIGIGAREAGLFLLLSHTFFKVLLLLCIGKIFPAPGSEGDANGLRRRLPVSSWAFLVGALAMGGMPPLVGFWGYAALLASIYRIAGDLFIWAAGCALLLPTAFFGARLGLIIFKEREEESEAREKEGESPLLILAFLGLGLLVVAGGAMEYFRKEGMIASLLAPPQTALPPLALVAVPGAVVLVGMGLAWAGRKSGKKNADKGENWLRHLLDEGFYVEEIGERLIGRPLVAVARWLRDVVDVLVIDLLCIGGLALTVRGAGWLLARMQSGQVWSCALGIAVGTAAILLLLAHLS